MNKFYQREVPMSIEQLNHADVSFRYIVMRFPFPKKTWLILLQLKSICCYSRTLISQLKQPQPVIFVIATSALYTQTCVESKVVNYIHRPRINNVGYIHWSLIWRAVSNTKVLASHVPTWILGLKGKAPPLPEDKGGFTWTHAQRSRTWSLPPCSLTALLLLSSTVASHGILLLPGFYVS